MAGVSNGKTELAAESAADPATESAAESALESVVELPGFTPVNSSDLDTGIRQSPCAACTVRQQSVCASLGDAELERLGAIAQPVDAAAGTTVFREGDPADYVFNVTDGVIKLYKLLADGREQITGFLFPGDFIGLALDEKFTYSAEAVAHSRLCKMNRGKFGDVLAQTPQLEHRLLTVASNELAQAQDQMLLLGRKTALEKIVSFFLQLAQRRDRSQLAVSKLDARPDEGSMTHAENIVEPGIGQAGDEDSKLSDGISGDIIVLPMGRADIADYLGLTTETVSRTLTQLKTDGLIQLLDNNRVRLRDREELSQIAEGL
jgi:CRP/FNR family transcriptional regulator